MENRRPSWSWAETEEDADAFRNEAAKLVGQRLTEVRYITLDYEADRFRDGVVGPRLVDAADEWAQPLWQHAVCDTVDFAVEFRTDADAAFTASWDSPGTREGLGLREGVAVGMAVTESANASIWDVSRHPGWRVLLGCEFTSVELVYEPWDRSGALWCRRIELGVDGKPITLLLAEGVWKSDALEPSADNIAVIFGSRAVAPWDDIPS